MQPVTVLDFFIIIAQPKKSKAERIEEKKAERRAKETEKTKVLPKHPSL